jgi:hypothetical protein
VQRTEGRKDGKTNKYRKKLRRNGTFKGFKAMEFQVVAFWVLA